MRYTRNLQRRTKVPGKLGPLVRFWEEHSRLTPEHEMKKNHIANINGHRFLRPYQKKSQLLVQYYLQYWNAYTGCHE
jgi:hypothetical protein